MNIRLATEKDYPTIYELVKIAFQTAQVTDGQEQEFVEKLRASNNYIPALEFVAEENGEMVGHVMLTKQIVNGEQSDVESLLVAPLCVKFEVRNQKIGAQLMEYSLNEAKKIGYSSAFLVGNPAYYSRFGFRATNEFGIQNATEIPNEYVLGCELQPHSLLNIYGSIRIV